MALRLFAAILTFLLGTGDVFAHGLGGFDIQNPVVRRLVLGGLATGVVILLLYHANTWAEEKVRSEASRGEFQER